MWSRQLLPHPFVLCGWMETERSRSEDTLKSSRKRRRSKSDSAHSTHRSRTDKKHSRKKTAKSKPAKKKHKRRHESSDDTDSELYSSPSGLSTLKIFQ